MPSPEEEREFVRAPKAGIKLMAIIVIAMALLAIYANVQKARRGQIEKVTVVPATPAPSVSPSPNE